MTCWYDLRSITGVLVSTITSNIIKLVWNKNICLTEGLSKWINYGRLVLRSQLCSINKFVNPGLNCDRNARIRKIEGT